jgi:hypothetical protein
VPSAIARARRFRARNRYPAPHTRGVRPGRGTAGGQPQAMAPR